MNAKHSVQQMVAVSLAFGLVLVGPLIVDFMFDTYIELEIIIWFNLGLFVMRRKNMDFPMPAPDRVDIPGGLRVLWWALFWPRYVFKN